MGSRTTEGSVAEPKITYLVNPDHLLDEWFEKWGTLYSNATHGEPNGPGGPLNNPDVGAKVITDTGNYRPHVRYHSTAGMSLLFGDLRRDISLEGKIQYYVKYS